MNLDWRRLKAVVLESDDWGLCAWVPDEQAHRVLAGEPAFRSVPGQRYGRSTLEHAADVRALAATLLEFRGADGLPPVWQANTIVAAPDFAKLEPPLFRAGELPVTGLDAPPSRWRRPGLVEAYHEAESRGVWRAELHGLHHLPEAAWLHALRRGEHDARDAAEHQSFVCAAVEASGEYDAAEPREVRARVLREAIRRFEELFGRAPASFCPPDYRFDDWLEAEAESLGLTLLQGKAEQGGGRWAALRRRWLGFAFPHRAGKRFYMPPRIAFEPRGSAHAAGKVGADAAHRRVREAWAHGRPAVVSSHRLNYAHLDPAWAEAGRAALRDLLARLCAEGATFLVDAEVRALCDRGWSVRATGPAGARLRHHGAAHAAMRFAAPAGAATAHIRPARAEGPHGAQGGCTITIEDGTAEARTGPGDWDIEWVMP